MGIGLGNSRDLLGSSKSNGSHYERARRDGLEPVSCANQAVVLRVTRALRAATSSHRGSMSSSRSVAVMPLLRSSSGELPALTHLRIALAAGSDTPPAPRRYVRRASSIIRRRYSRAYGDGFVACRHLPPLSPTSPRSASRFHSMNRKHVVLERILWHHDARRSGELGVHACGLSEITAPSVLSSFISLSPYYFSGATWLAIYRIGTSESDPTLACSFSSWNGGSTSLLIT